MQLNIFMGARRLAAVVASAWLLWWAWYALTREPTGQLLYVVSAPDEAPKLADVCGADAALDYKSMDIAGVGSFTISLCFEAQTTAGSRKLVPYSMRTVTVHFPDGTDVDGVPEGMTRAEVIGFIKNAGYAPEKLIGPDFESRIPKQTPPPKKVRHYIFGESGSTEVMSYTSEVRRKFRIPDADIPAAKRAVQQSRYDNYKAAGMYAVGGVGIGWLVMAAVGWVARGFMGIQRGKDRSGD